MLRKLIPLIKENYPQLEKVNYLTDSPTSQYRNKTIFILLCNHQNEFEGIQAKWDYLEAGHGKGPCDGLGASVKRSADMAIRQSKGQYKALKNFFYWAKNSSNNSTVSYFYISQEDYDTCDRDVKALCDTIVAVPGTMKAHPAVPVGTTHVAIRDMCCIVLNA